MTRLKRKEEVIEELDRARAKHGFRLLGCVLVRFPTAELWGTPMVWYRSRLNGIGRVTIGIRVKKMYL
jgi:hypothetical protein